MGVGHVLYYPDINLTDKNGIRIHYFLGISPRELLLKQSGQRIAKRSLGLNLSQVSQMTATKRGGTLLKHFKV